MKRWLVTVAWCWPVVAALAGQLAAAEFDGPRQKLVFCCAADNDLYRVLTAGGADCLRHDNAKDALRAAPEGSGVLILADRYPDRTTAVEPAAFAEARRKKLRLYVEFPAELPDFTVGSPQDAKTERGVVTSTIFGDRLRPLRIVIVNGCRYVPLSPAPETGTGSHRPDKETGTGSDRPDRSQKGTETGTGTDRPDRSLSPFPCHLALAKVAGVDTAVYGLENTPSAPVLFDHPRGDLLVATTKLSHFVSGRYMPMEAWRTIWQTILGRLQPDGPAATLNWTPTVRPSYGPEEPLPADAEQQALRRSADWIIRSRILRHPKWPQQVLDWALSYNTVRDMPAADWPLGDGSLGLLEGFSSTIRTGGDQPMRYAVRNDCTAEVAMLLAGDAAVSNRPEHARIAANLLDYIFSTSGLAGGPRADPDSPSYGLVGWALDHPGSYWGDDNARALLAAGAVSALLKDARWAEAVARCVLANFRTAGQSGFRPSCVQQEALQKQGWQAYWNRRHVHYSPHYQAWIWACYLWAYEQTRFEPLLARTRTGMRMMMTAYPAKWNWCLRSGTIERSRFLLPLAWLVRIQDTPEHRRWLRQIADDLAALQDPSGGIREVIGDGGQGIASNAAYGTGETSLIQTDGDPVSDMLYSCNFALVGLHEAAAATGDPFYARAEDKLARFLCRIQIRSGPPEHPELDGAWYRAFHSGRWEYCASNADWEWGPWCTETGWCQPWIAGTLALRRQQTSLWELVQKVDLRTPFERLRPQMLPDEVLKSPQAPHAAHAAVDKSVTLSVEPDPRYPGCGAAALTDGVLGAAEHGSPEWLGFLGTDLEAIVDLGAPTQIRRLGLNCLESTRVGIFPPRQVEFAVSLDGEQYWVVKTIETAQPREHSPPRTQALTADGLDAEGRYVRVRTAKFGPLPPWVTPHPVPAWLFVDEVLVNPAAN